MDFHALPRRDLQALCKLNSIRANMTNAAMADALGALPAVAGIEEYFKQPADEPTPAAKAVVEEEKHGIPPPRGRRVSFNLPEPLMREDEGKEKRDEHKDTAPALGVGRCALAEPVVAPCTKRRAAASKTEAGDVASEAVPVPAEDVASEAVPVHATRLRAAASKTEAEDVASEAVPVHATRRRAAASKTEAEDVAAASKTEAEDVASEAVPVHATRRRPAASKTEAEDVASEAVPVHATRRRPAASKTEAGDVSSEAVPAVPATRRRSAASKTEVAAEAVPAPTTRERRQRTVALVAEAKAPMARRTARRAPVTKTGMQQEEQGEGTQGVVSDVKTIVPTPVSDQAPDEGAMNPENEERNEVAEELSQEEEEISGAPMETATQVEEEPPVAEDYADNSSSEEQQVDVKQCEDLQIVLSLVEQEECAPFRDAAGSGEGPLDEEMIHHSSEETETVPVKEEARAKLKSVEAAENVSEVPTFGEELHSAAKAKEAGTDDGFLLEEREGLCVDEVLHNTYVVVEEDGVVATDKIPESLATVNVDVDQEATENVSEVPTFGEELHSAAKAKEAGTDDGFLLEEREGLSVDEVLHNTDVAVEEDGVVATDKIPQILAIVNVDVDPEARATENVSEVPTFGEEELHSAAKAKETGTDDDFLLEEREGLSVDEVMHDTVVAVEEDGVVATDKKPESLVTVNVDVDQEAQAMLKSAEATENVSEVLPTFGEEELRSVAKAKEVGTDDGFLFEEREGLAVDEVMHGTDVVVEEDGMVATDKIPLSLAPVNVDVDQEVFTLDDLSQVKATDVEGAGEESALTGYLPPVLDARDCSDHSTPPLFAGMLDDVTKSVSMDSVTVESKVPEEACDVSPCMYNNSNEKNIITKSVAVEQKEEVKEGNKSEAMGNLSLRKLRLKLKETVAVGQENEVKECKKSMDSVTVEPKVSEEAGDVSLCMYNNSNEKNITESVAVEQEGVKEGDTSEAMGNLRLKLKETVAVEQENEVKEGKKSMALDMLSLRKLRIKLKETLIAHKSREPNRVPLGRLDENVC